MVAKNKMQDSVAVENGRTVVLTADVPPVANDGLPIPHKRAQWSPAEVVKWFVVDARCRGRDESESGRVLLDGETMSEERYSAQSAR